MRVITLMNRKLLIAAIAVVIIIVGAFGAFALSNNTSSQIGNSVNIDANALKDMGNIVVNNSKDSKEKGLVSASSSDLNSILVTNNGKLTIKDSLVNKTGDTATSGDDADFYGVNSAILVNTNGTLDISNVEINTNSKGSNGIFVTNSEASTSSSSQRAAMEDNLQKQPEMVATTHRVEAEDNLQKCHQVKVDRILETVAEIRQVQVM